MSSSRSRTGRSGDDVVERAPFEELADDERLAVLFTRFVHRAHVRVRNERRDPRFVMKPVDRAGAGHLLRSQQLDRDLAIEPQVARAIDLGRAVTADGLKELVV